MANIDSVYKPSAVIANNTAASEAVNISKVPLRGLSVLVPTTWTAADIGFQVSNDALTWHTLYDETGVGVKISGIATSGGGLYTAPANLWMAGNFAYLRLVSRNTSTFATDVNQGAARTLILGAVQ